MLLGHGKGEVRVEASATKANEKTKRRAPLREPPTGLPCPVAIAMRRNTQEVITQYATTDIGRGKRQKGNEDATNN